MIICLTIMPVYDGNFFYFVFIVNKFTYLLEIKKKQNIK